jgi:signal transduction histidine kinase
MLGIILILVSIVLALTYRSLTYRRRINKRLDQMVQQKTKELRDTNEELIRSRKELDSFLYRTSHDIRGPIATLMGLTKLARLEAQDHLMQSYLEKIEFTGNKLNAVISRLTNVSQINSQPLDIQDINVYQVINEVINELKLNRNAVAFKLTGDTSPKIKTDKILLKIILENLLDNSFKFYDEKEKDPFVELNVEQNGHLQFTVTDNGVGIDPEYMERVFELFFVANEKERGTGIGLYQTQLAIKKLDGNVILTTNKKPTSFKVVIPANGQENNFVKVA